MSSTKAEVLKLRNFERILAKAQTACLERLDHHESSNLLVFSKEQESKRNEEIYSLKCKMVAIYKPVYKIKDIFRNKDIEQIDLKELKEEMLQIQKNIEILKNEAAGRLEELKNEEMDLTKEVTTFEDVVAEWEKPLDIKDCDFLVPKRISTSANNLCQEAKDFLYFVAKSGGHENGWSVEDHRLFLNIRSKKNPAQLAQTLHKMLPDISKEEIIAHEEWYKKYLILKEKQKVAIETWRKTKKAISNSGTRKCVSAPASKIKTRFPANKTTKEEIVVWKQKREEQLKNKLESKRLEKMKEKQSDEVRKKKNEELKKEINQWKSSKLMKTHMEKIALEQAQRHEKLLKATEANKLIKQFQSQDDIYTQKKKMLTMKKRANSEERVKPKIVASRDPERVLKPTKNWLSKLKNEQEEFVKEVPICSIRNIERLHFPDWRKGIL